MKIKSKELPLGINLPLSIFYWIIVILGTMFFVVVGILILVPLSLILDRKRTGFLLHALSAAWGKFLIGLNPLWKLKVTGQHHISKYKRYVIVANHQSMLDILAVLAGLPIHFKFIAKKELFPIPFIGWHMGFAKYIPLDRSSKESGKKALFAISQWLKKEVSILIFPEGTRSTDGKIHNFKVGAFKIAQEEHVEILPIVIDGTGDILPKHSWMAGRLAQIHFSIGKPVAVSKASGLSLEDAKEAIRQEMIERLAKIRSQKV